MLQKLTEIVTRFPKTRNEISFRVHRSHAACHAARGKYSREGHEQRCSRARARGLRRAEKLHRRSHRPRSVPVVASRRRIRRLGEVASRRSIPRDGSAQEGVVSKRRYHRSTFDQMQRKRELRQTGLSNQP